jgi:hypothetical protein
MSKKKPTRRIKAAKISLISLVPAGANEVRSLFKSKGQIELAAVAKMGVEGYLTSLVYSPDRTDFEGDTAEVPAIKQMAHDFITNMEGTGIDVLHSCEPLSPEQARVCETFIVQKGDPRFVGITDDRGEAIDPEGSWGVVIKIDDPDLRSRYATGEWVGVSMFGSAIVEPVTKSQDLTKDSTMDEKMFAELLKSFGADLSATIVEGLAKALAPKEDPKPEPVAKTSVEFEGDPMNPEDLAKHADKVLLASLDLGNPEDLAKWQAHVVAKQAPKADPVDETPAEIAKLQAQLLKLQGRSVAGGDVPADAPALTTAQKLAKATARAVQLKKEGVIR